MELAESDAGSVIDRGTAVDTGGAAMAANVRAGAGHSRSLSWTNADAFLGTDWTRTVEGEPNAVFLAALRQATAAALDVAPLCRVTDDSRRRPGQRIVTPVVLHHLVLRATQLGGGERPEWRAPEAEPLADTVDLGAASDEVDTQRSDSRPGAPLPSSSATGKRTASFRHDVSPLPSETLRSTSIPLQRGLSGTARSDASALLPAPVARANSGSGSAFGGVATSTGSVSGGATRTAAPGAGGSMAAHDATLALRNAVLHYLHVAAEREEPLRWFPPLFGPHASEAGMALLADTVHAIALAILDPVCCTTARQLAVLLCEANSVVYNGLLTYDLPKAVLRERGLLSAAAEEAATADGEDSESTANNQQDEAEPFTRWRGTFLGVIFRVLDGRTVAPRNGAGPSPGLTWATTGAQQKAHQSPLGGGLGGWRHAGELWLFIQAMLTDSHVSGGLSEDAAEALAARGLSASGGGDSVRDLGAGASSGMWRTPGLDFDEVSSVAGTSKCASTRASGLHQRPSRLSSGHQPQMRAGAVSDDDEDTAEADRTIDDRGEVPTPLSRTPMRPRSRHADPTAGADDAAEMRLSASGGAAGAEHPSVTFERSVDGAASTVAGSTLVSPQQNRGVTVPHGPAGDAPAALTGGSAVFRAASRASSFGPGMHPQNSGAVSAQRIAALAELATEGEWPLRPVVSFLARHTTSLLHDLTRLTRCPVFLPRRAAIRLLMTVTSEPQVWRPFSAEVLHSPALLASAMLALEDRSPHVRMDAYHVVKCFVMFPAKCAPVRLILQANRETLASAITKLAFPREFDVDATQMRSERTMIVNALGQLAPITGLDASALARLLQLRGGSSTPADDVSSAGGASNDGRDVDTETRDSTRRPSAATRTAAGASNTSSPAHSHPSPPGFRRSGRHDESASSSSLLQA